MTLNKDRVSRLLAYVLRHRPQELGLELSREGWVEVDLLLARLSERRGVCLSVAQLQELVASDAKGRYSLREGRIRANQGHSVEAVEAVERTPRTPPERLFHGTTEERWARIQRTGGLSRMNRHFVHLSASFEVALETGRRHRRETPLVLVVDAGAMVGAGMELYCSENGVWLVDSVPLEYLRPFKG
ncbi:MAG: putative RNA 2'-phosphotransferase [Candidatus Xenobia bacterium]|jgi:putative RNA 2'-phosphotransferase